MKKNRAEKVITPIEAGFIAKARVQLKEDAEFIRDNIKCYLDGVLGSELSNRLVANKLYEVRSNKKRLTDAGYKNYAEWAETTLGIKKAIANRYAQVGEYIGTDGKSRFAYLNKAEDGTETMQDFSVTAIARLLALKQLPEDKTAKTDYINEFIGIANITPYTLTEDIAKMVTEHNQQLLPEKAESTADTENETENETETETVSKEEEERNTLEKIQAMLHGLTDEELDIVAVLIEDEQNRRVEV